MQFAFGSGRLYGIRNDLPNQTPTRFGALQDIQIDFKGELKTLFGQNQYPLDAARGKVTISGKAKLASINGALFNSLFFGQTLTVGQTLVAENESQTPASGSMTAANGATFDQDLGVYYQSSGLPLQLATAASVPGKYTVNNAGVYAVNTGDNGKPLFLNYTYTSATTGVRISGVNPFMGTTPKFMAIFTENYGGQTLTLKLFSCVSESFSMPTKIDDYAINELDFQAFANAGGFVFDLSMSAAA